MAMAASVTVMDDEQVRVTTGRSLPTSMKTGHHVHEYDYLVVPVVGGRFAIIHVAKTTSDFVNNLEIRSAERPATATTSSTAVARRRGRRDGAQGVARLNRLGPSHRGLIASGRLARALTDMTRVGTIAFASRIVARPQAL